MFKGETEPRLIKRENLKTPGGVSRTNGFQRGEHGRLYEKMSRFNHSCKPNTTELEVNDVGKVFLVAARDIKKGEELTVQYGATGSTSDRKAFLEMKYNFDCQCEACQANETVTENDRATAMANAIVGIGLMWAIESAALSIYDCNF